MFVVTGESEDFGITQNGGGQTSESRDREPEAYTDGLFLK